VTAAVPGAPVGNPFCTRHVRPGRLPFLDTDGRPIELARLVSKVAAGGASAALVGPHGSGKTTLLGHLADALEARGERVVRTRVGRAGDAVMLLVAVVGARGGDIICIDSWERLGAAWAFVVRRWASAKGVRLLVTAHRTGPLSTLWECTATPAVLGAIVARLPCGGAGSWPIHEADVDEAFRAAAGDIREALFLLYDTFEVRTRAVREAAV
jgi:energy-coupling factor transporter ATP-binding protein EcfA2